MLAIYHIFVSFAKKKFDIRYSQIFVTMLSRIGMTDFSFFHEYSFTAVEQCYFHVHRSLSILSPSLTVTGVRKSRESSTRLQITKQTYMHIQNEGVSFGFLRDRSTYSLFLRITFIVILRLQNYGCIVHPSKSFLLYSRGRIRGNCRK